MAEGRIIDKEKQKGCFYPIYTQFEGRPKDAIRFLMKKKCGQCSKVFYRNDIGYIDIVWGEVTNPIKQNGFGLCHIIHKHKKEINKLGYEVEDFIPIVIEYGELKPSLKANTLILESKQFRIIIKRSTESENNQWILSAFDLRNTRKKAAK